MKAVFITLGILSLLPVSSLRADEEGAPESEDHRIVDSRSGETITMDALVEALMSRDAVFLGEEHDNTVGHRLQLEIIQSLLEKREDLVVAMEMFERDTQGVLNDYLRGRIDEEALKAHARPWRNYDRHYRPIIEFAKERGLDVIAGNMPTRGPAKVRFQTFDALVPSPNYAREFEAPKDGYWRLFEAAMGGHVGADSGDAVVRMYGAQCLKDESMAEAMVDYLELHPHREPLMVHLNGKFHSDYGYGAALRFLRRKPLLSIGVVTMVSGDSPTTMDVGEHLDAGHFVLVVQSEKKEAAPAREAQSK